MNEAADRSEEYLADFQKSSIMISYHRTRLKLQIDVEQGIIDKFSQSLQFGKDTMIHSVQIWLPGLGVYDLKATISGDHIFDV